MALAPEPPQWLQTWNRPRIGWAGGLSGVLVLSSILVLPPVGDAVAIAGALTIGAIASWAWRARSALEALPLTLGDVAVRQVVDGRPALRFRLWLGHGRAMRGIEVRVVLHAARGLEVPVEVDIPAQHACGPVTLTAFLPPLARGELAVAATVRSGGRDWTAEHRYAIDRAPLGPLDAPVRSGRRGLEWDRAGWDRPLSGR